MMRRAGFTLIEVLVALVVASLVVLLAHRTYGEVAGLSGRIAEHRLAHDRAMNARRLLAAAFGSLDISTRRDGGFDGRETAARFTAWVPGLDGRSQRRRVWVYLAEAGLEATVGTDTLLLVPDARAVAFDYLLDYGADAAWVHGWSSPASAPLAVRMRVTRGESGGAVDTLLFVIGPRG